MKVITIIGRLTKECEVRKNTRGEFATFSVAVDDGYGDNKGTIYFGVNYFRTQLAQYLTKGTQVGVTGEFKTREYEGKTYLSVNASEVKLLGKKPENNRYAEGDKIDEETTEETSNQTPSQDFDDEIPF